MAEETPKNTSENPANPPEASLQILPKVVEAVMKEAYLNYAMSVIVGRALPDVRDGLKPVHRRILYSMYEMGLFHNKPFKKSARITGDTMGKYHPHGDAAVYDALVRMAQDFSLRYPLIKGQGNFGCFTGDTTVALTDGRNLPFQDLVKEHARGKKNYTYTINSSGQIEIAEIHSPRLTKNGAQIVKVCLDNGEEIKCTPDHRFMLKNGEYCEAQHLQAGVSLMPLYLRLSTKEDGIKPALVGYQMVHQPQPGEWISVHTLADQWNLAHDVYTKSDGKVRHHADFNKLNNNPDNILRIPWKEHWEIHAQHASLLHLDETYRQKIAAGRQEYWSRPENRKKAKDYLSERNRQNWKREEYRQHMQQVLRQVNLEFSKSHPEVKTIRSERLKRLWKDKGYQRLMSDLKTKEMKSRWRKNMSQYSQALWADASYRGKFPENHFQAMAKKLWEDPKTKEFHRLRMLRQRENPLFQQKMREALALVHQQRLVDDPDFMKRMTEKAKVSLRQKWKDPSYKRKVMRSKILRYVNTLLREYDAITPTIYNEKRSNNCLPRAKNALKYFDNFSQIVQEAKVYNHKVLWVEFLVEREDVYDLTIERTHNFALAAGVFVHNSLDGDNAAAQRYTEAKLTSIAGEMLQDLDKNTVPFRDNFDGSLKEPEILPSVIPELLINGSSGIAVGMATNIPPHNLKEVCQGIIATINQPDISTEELMRIIPGPDFPTGGEVICGNALRYAYEKGRGKVTIKSVTGLESRKIIVTEIPYMVNKAEMIEQIADLVRDKKIPGIRNINDESDRDGIRVVIDLKQDADSSVVLNQLYQYSRLKVSFGLNLLALVDSQPKLLGLKDFIQHHIQHRRNIITLRTKYDLEQAQQRLHIVDGLLIALDHIDPIVQGIKQSRTVDDAKQFLIIQYTLSELQAKAILDLRLQKLASLEQEHLRTEHQELLQTITSLEEILQSEQKVLDLIKQELQQLQEKYADARRSKITFSEEEDSDVDIEDLIEENQVVVTITQSGYVKRQPLDMYRTQRRGGKGIIATGTKEEDIVQSMYIASTHDYLLCFTDQGQLYWLKVWQIPDAGRQAKGKHIAQVLEMASGERITAVVPVSGFQEGYLLMATKMGTVKKTELMEFSNPRKGGIRAITLDLGDTLINVHFTDGNQEIILATKEGMANRFKESDVRSMGRSATGVRGIRLHGGDEVIGMLVAQESKNILTLTTFGYGKRTPVQDYRLCNRGGTGVTNIKITEKNGPVTAVMLVNGEEELMLVSQQGVGIRIRCSDISVIGRATQGVRVMRLEGSDRIAAAAKITFPEKVIDTGDAARDQLSSSLSSSSPPMAQPDVLPKDSNPDGSSL